MSHDGRRFVVSSGDLQVEVLGTAFEVAKFSDRTVVAVSEGAVSVTDGDNSWQLSPGEQLVYNESSIAQIKSGALENTASWRNDLLISDEQSLSNVIEILNRRLDEHVVIVGNGLATTQIVGTFDLTDPDGSLSLLKELTGARLFALPFGPIYMHR